MVWVEDALRLPARLDQARRSEDLQVARSVTARLGRERELCGAIDGSPRCVQNSAPVTARRLVVVALAAIWLLPIALASGVALHVAFDHGHDAESQGGHGNQGGHDGEGHAEALPSLLEHGHLHAGDVGEHEHALVSASTPAVRAARAVCAPPPESLIAVATLSTHEAARLAAGPPLAPPPQLAGPLLLALLSTLRV